jgi:DNA repair protein SbcD/Mre11
MTIKILHFADAHIDIANYGRYDPQSGLPLRVLDFLKSLDTIIDAAIEEKVDLVLFAGDAYKDRNPTPTFQREWGKRMMRLSRAAIPTLLLIGNHDIPPAYGRANTLEAFDTLDVPHIQVIDIPRLLKPNDLETLPVQVIGMPWISRSRLITNLEIDIDSGDLSTINQNISKTIQKLVLTWLEEKIDPNLPVIFLAHCSVEGALLGNERNVMLGNDLVLPESLVKDPRFDYVALGHIHKSQNLNPDAHPPVIYPGSIERVDFNEARDKKNYVIAHIERGKTDIEWHPIEGIRPFLDRYLRLEEQEGINEKIRQALPEPDKMQGAIFRLILEYPRDWEASINEAILRELTKDCFEFHLVKRPQVETRIRIPGNQTIGSLSALDLLDLYWKSNQIDPLEAKALNQLAKDVIRN